MLHDVCISKSGTLTEDKMTASSIHFIGTDTINIKDVASQYKNQQFFLSGLFKERSNHHHDPDLVALMENCVIGGTNSWLDINDNPGNKSAKAFRKEPAQNPVYCARGDSIENATMQFLLDSQEDVMQMINQRNKFQRVICRIPFLSLIHI